VWSYVANLAYGVTTARDPEGRPPRARALRHPAKGVTRAG